MHVKKNIPNILTAFRILGTILLLFFQTFSQIFIIAYLGCGISDMLDGLLARKLHAESKFGEKFDSIADLLFIIVCLFKIIPYLKLSTWVIIWIILIALTRVTNIILGYVSLHKILFLHTKANKLTGLLLFLTPLLLLWIPIVYISLILCMVATIAAIEEGFLIIKFQFK